MAEKKFAIILSGSGVYDGAEIHESVMSLYAIQLNNCSYEIFAPNIKQHHVVNHISGEDMDEERNVLIESARIARGSIKDLSEYDQANFDIMLLPGGFGVAKNLSSFAFEGADCKVLPQVEEAIRSTFNAKKPIGALCISPVILAKVLGDIEITIGQDLETSNALTQMGAKSSETDHREIVVDMKNKLVTSPCYMLDANLVDIAEGAKNTVKALLEL